MKDGEINLKAKANIATQINVLVNNCCHVEPDNPSLFQEQLNGQSILTKIKKTHLVKIIPRPRSYFIVAIDGAGFE